MFKLQQKQPRKPPDSSNCDGLTALFLVWYDDHKVEFMKKYIIFFAIISLVIVLCSCQNKKNETELSGIELHDVDYEIINRYENEIHDDDITIRQIGLIIKITNLEKLGVLENSINPVIYLYIDDHRYSAKGNFYYLSSAPDSDFFFPVDDHGGILVSENKRLSLEDNTIKFIGFIPRITQ